MQIFSYWIALDASDAKKYSKHLIIDVYSQTIDDLVQMIIDSQNAFYGKLYRLIQWSVELKSGIIDTSGNIVLDEWIHKLHVLTCISFSFRMGISTVCTIVKETMDMILTVLYPVHMPVPSKDDLKNVSDDFYQKRGFPHCIVSILWILST